MSDSLHRGFAPAGFLGAPGETDSAHLSPNAPQLNAQEFGRVVLRTFQLIATAVFLFLEAIIVKDMIELPDALLPIALYGLKYFLVYGAFISVTGLAIWALRRMDPKLSA
tara:strand:- start:234 stop:563 length:330 start_codon:yes stop_codon:yes gene_type:complete